MIFADLGRDTTDLFGDVLAHALDFLRFWRIMQQELLGKPHGSKRQAEHLTDVSLLGDGYLATAAAEIEEQNIFILDTQVRKNPKVNQAPLFESRNDLDLPAHCRLDPFQECARVLGIA